MANIFTLKHGSGVPDNKLYPFELGFDEIGKKLYIGGAITSGGELGSAIPIIPGLSDLGITATTEELNKLDGLTATTAELNKLKGLTATTAELNILDGITATTSELNILDGITATTAELNYVKGVTSSIQTQLNEKEPAINLTASRALVSNSSGKVAVSAVTSTELGYLDGVTSAIQTQLNGKEPTINLTASRALVSNSSGKVAVSAVTSKELGYLDGVTSNIQTQLDGKFSMTELWKNANPASSFSSQTISMNLTGYNMIICLFRLHTDTNKVVPITLAVVGGIASYSYGFTSGCQVRRDVTATTTGVTITDASRYTSYGSTNVVTANSNLIPITIYGIKGVS